ncbi:MAG: monooxygenase [Chloroflexi bacterium]|nr:monooxygenase [Chloroflexota bacterium]
MLKNWRFLLLLALILGTFLVIRSESGSKPTASLAHPPGSPPTYYHDIAPIIAQHCLTCHTAGGIGTVALDTPELAIENSAKIALTAAVHDMPPWMPGPESPTMLHERKLTDDEINLLVDWARADAPLGDPSEATEIIPETIPSIRQDVVLTMPAYTPDENLRDDYRCFLIDPQIAEDRYVTAYTVQPGQPSEVHHVLLYQIEGWGRAQAERRDAQDEGLGWQCFGGPDVAGVDGGLENSIGSWTPGTFPTEFPEGTGIRLIGGGLIVMQVHYNLSAGARPDQTSAILQLAPTGAAIQPLTTYSLYAPVEIPCPADATNPACDRATSLKQVFEQTGRGAGGDFLSMCHRSLDDYLHQDASHITSTCEYPVPYDLEVISVLGHMHLRGKSIRIESNPDETDGQVILDIPDWDFHWQGGYILQNPIELKHGDTVRITCIWDNTHGDNLRYIFWGEGTEDEMCLGAVITRQPAR